MTNKGTEEKLSAQLVSDYDYDLPPELIAQEPAEAREASRLLQVPKDGSPFTDRQFSNLPGLLKAGDLLVINDTRVIPARLIGEKDSGGRVEIFLSKRISGRSWEALISLGSGRARPGMAVNLDQGRVLLEAPLDDALWQVRLESGLSSIDWLERVGSVPLPPYIRRDDGQRRLKADMERYQTVYARHPGAVAAPTAGLHFTPELFAKLESAGIQTAQLTLHVGLGTFQPLRVDRVEDVKLHSEVYRLPLDTIAAIAETRKCGGRVVAVGTTSVRVLEHAAQSGQWHEHEGETSLFLRPGSRFEVVDAIITNFHLPRSSLLMLIAAFAGKDLVDRAYRHAIREGYRFYSYGDAMLLE